MSLAVLLTTITNLLGLVVSFGAQGVRSTGLCLRRRGHDAMVCVENLCCQSAHQASRDAVRTDLVPWRSQIGLSCGKAPLLHRLTLVPLIVGMGLREAWPFLSTVPVITYPYRKVVPAAKSFAKTNKKVLGLCQNRPARFLLSRSPLACRGSVAFCWWSC